GLLPPKFVFMICTAIAISEGFYGLELRKAILPSAPSRSQPCFVQKRSADRPSALRCLRIPLSYCTVILPCANTRRPSGNWASTSTQFVPLFFGVKVNLLS